MGGGTAGVSTFAALAVGLTYAEQDRQIWRPDFVGSSGPQRCTCTPRRERRGCCRDHPLRRRDRQAGG
jgi:hypothetical protein